MQETDTEQSQKLPKMMRAIALLEPNDAMSISELTLPLPECDDNELLVKVEYVGLNPVDASLAQKGSCSLAIPAHLRLRCSRDSSESAKGCLS